MQQGRVLLDADWNNQTEINLRRQRAQTVDSIGRAVVPTETPGIEIVRNVGIGWEGDGEGAHAYVRYRGVRVPAENLRGPFDKVPGPSSPWSGPDQRRLLSCARLHLKTAAHEDRLFSYVHNESFTLLDCRKEEVESMAAVAICRLRATVAWKSPGCAVAIWSTK